MRVERLEEAADAINQSTHTHRESRPLLVEIKYLFTCRVVMQDRNNSSSD